MLRHCGHHLKTTLWALSVDMRTDQVVLAACAWNMHIKNRAVVGWVRRLHEVGERYTSPSDCGGNRCKM